MEVKLRDLVLAGSPVTAPVKGKINLDTLHSNAHFVNKLDLRGMRREEAIKNLESFVDEALIANGEELKIIHGKGDGILRKAVRSKLREYKAVKEMRFEEPELGGDGVTIVSLG
ncbi:MAG: Smr/MutS family protein [Bacteroidota bacterium]